MDSSVCYGAWCQNQREHVAADWVTFAKPRRRSVGLSKTWQDSGRESNDRGPPGSSQYQREAADRAGGSQGQREAADLAGVFMTSVDDSTMMNN